jgi:hypothetical protein
MEIKVKKSEREFDWEFVKIRDDIKIPEKNKEKDIAGYWFVKKDNYKKE